MPEPLHLDSKPDVSEEEGPEIADAGQALVPRDGSDWIRLAMTMKEPEIEILRAVYLPEPRTLTYQEVYARLERLGYSERSTRRKIAQLAKRHLVVRIHSVLGFVGSAPEHASQVCRLLEFLEKRRRFPTSGTGITQALLGLLQPPAKETSDP